VSDTRDLRDPEALVEAYLKVRDLGLEIVDAVHMPCNRYQDGGHISNDPAMHHSKTPQTLGDLNDGGEG
jgi:hypothetical protein